MSKHIKYLLSEQIRVLAGSYVCSHFHPIMFPQGTCGWRRSSCTNMKFPLSCHNIGDTDNTDLSHHKPPWEPSELTPSGQMKSAQDWNGLLNPDLTTFTTSCQQPYTFCFNFFCFWHKMHSWRLLFDRSGELGQAENVQNFQLHQSCLMSGGRDSLPHGFTHYC